MTVEKLLKIITNNYLYFQSKMLKSVTEKEYNMYNNALQGVYCIMLDIEREENYKWPKNIGPQND